jgi:hypothetical protein
MSVLSGATGTVRAAARPGTYSGQNRVPAVIALWLILVLIAAARNGKVPDQKHVIALGVATVFVAAGAAIAPKIVFYLLLAAVVVVAATNSDTIVNAVDQGTAKLTTALGR